MFCSSKPKLTFSRNVSHAPGSAISKSLAAHIRSKYPAQSHSKFNVEITDNKPTPEQLRIIEHCKGFPSAPPPSKPVASEETAAAATDSKESNKVPILIDWDHGKVAVDNEALALKILQERDNVN